MEGGSRKLAEQEAAAKAPHLTVDAAKRALARDHAPLAYAAGAEGRVEVLLEQPAHPSSYVAAATIGGSVGKQGHEHGQQSTRMQAAGALGFLAPPAPGLCGVCRMVPREPTVAPSGYVFCASCALGAARREAKCPVSGQMMKVEDLRRLYETSRPAAS